MKIKEIHFNHGAAGSIPLCHAPGPDLNDRPIAITAPEWQDGASQPVAYARGSVKGPITIKVSFTNGPPNRRIKIRALGPIGPQLRRTGPTRATTVLGTVKPRLVKFDAKGESGLHTFQLTGQIKKAVVDRIDVTWDWQSQVATGGVWQDFSTTSHLVYITLLMPTKPWLDAAAEMTPRCWIEALQLANEWAGGASTVDECVLRVATRINEHPMLEYDEDGKQFVTLDVFQLSTFLNAMNVGPSNKIDCQGVANALVSFANLLGGNLQLLILENDANDPTEPGKFGTHLILPLSDQPWREKSWEWHMLAVHAASPVFDSLGSLLPTQKLVDDQALVGLEAQGLRVYDANVHLNEPSPVFPIGIRLGNARSGDQEYRDRFIQTGHAAVATPLPVNSAV